MWRGEFELLSWGGEGGIGLRGLGWIGMDCADLDVCGGRFWKRGRLLNLVSFVCSIDVLDCEGELGLVDAVALLLALMLFRG
jgi:hypothetical protein